MSDHDDVEQVITMVWRAHRASEHRQLLTERHVLERARLVSTADQHEGSEHDDKRLQHDLSCCAIDDRINRLVGDLILANDRWNEGHVVQLWPL